MGVDTNWVFFFSLKFFSVLEEIAHRIVVAFNLQKGIIFLANLIAVYLIFLFLTVVPFLCDVVNESDGNCGHLDTQKELLEG